MVENALIKHMFRTDADMADNEQFDLSAKMRRARMREILSIARRNHILQGFTPIQFRTMLEELGPSFVKIGQTLSMRSEILPQSFCDELAKLQTTSAPLPFSEIMAALNQQFGGHADEVFIEIDEEPLGSASLAQVHRGRLHSGEEVAIKIQRPGVKEKMALDIDIMRKLAHRFRHLMPEAQLVDLQEVIEELWKTFLEETDFRREADNIERFRLLNAPCRYVDGPKVYRNYCTEFVLVMEYINGIPINNRKRLLADGYDLEDIAVKLLDNYTNQILTDGFFHADPHPGNILIRGGQIVYIDLGNMGKLSNHDRLAFTEIIRAVGQSSAMMLKDALLSFSVTPPPRDLDHSRFLQDLDLLLQNYTTAAIQDLDLGAFLTNIFALTGSFHIEMPASMTNVARGLLTVQGTVAPLLSRQNIATIIYEHLNRQIDPFTRLRDDLTSTVVSLRNSAESLKDATIYSGEALKMLTRGQLKVNMELLGSEEPFDKLSRIMFRMTLALIITGLLIGSALLSLTEFEPRTLGIPIVAIVGFASAFVLSVWVVFDLWRGRHHF